MNWIRHHASELVYGANDGLITTFAVIAGVAGAELAPRVLLVLGFANLLADGFSMAASNFLAARSQEVDANVKEALQGSLATFLAFVLVGTVPLLAHLSGLGFPGTSSIALLTLFVVGAFRTRVTKRGWLRSGLEMLFVGTLAGAVAFFIGRLLAGV